MLHFQAIGGLFFVTFCLANSLPKENDDRLVQNWRELANMMAYTLNNPVKAGLIAHWQEWKFSYVSPKFEIYF